MRVTQHAPEAGGQIVSVKAFGVGVSVEVRDPSLLDAVRAILPPTARPCSPRDVEASFALATRDGLCSILQGETKVVSDVDPRVALGVLDSKIRAAVSTGATERVFIHAGAVAVADRAIVIPGRSFSGKTTLVRALIEAGASYFSDEYAVLDADGRVHPYPKPLSIRENGSRVATSEVPAHSLGAGIGDTAVTVGLVVLTSFEPGATWAPSEGTPSDAALAMFEHAVAARLDPKRVMGAVSKAAAEAQLLEGQRGEASETAAALLALVASGSEVR
jgi:hypothetical protein